MSCQSDVNSGLCSSNENIVLDRALETIEANTAAAAAADKISSYM